MKQEDYNRQITRLFYQCNLVTRERMQHEFGLEHSN